MPPRIRQSLGNPFRDLHRPSNNFTSRASLTRPFTCSSCRTQQQDHYSPSQTQTQTQTAIRPQQQPQTYSPIPQRRLPRWAATPARMSAPVSLRQNSPKNRYNVNEDPARLDKAYTDVFGDGGASLLTEDVKWLAVTHKSFDQGRRGYNDRLAYLGKRIVDLQTSLALLAQPVEPGVGVDPEVLLGTKDAVGRTPYRHPAMDILPKLSFEARLDHSRQGRVAALASEFGLHAVVRWKPRSAAELAKSGQNFVLAQALYAMIGALALQKGGDVAVKAVRARILPRLGLKV